MEKLDQSTKKDKRNEKKKNEKNATTQEKIRVKQDNQEIRKLFKKSLSLANMSSVQTYHIDPSEELDHKVTDKMLHLLRNKREMEKIGSSMNESKPAQRSCSVKNMTCIKFPSKNHCKGIAVGNCGSRTDFLVMLFTPHIVTVTIVSVLVVILVAFRLSQTNKLMTENRVEPSDEEDEEAPKNGAIKTQEHRTSFGWISPSCMKVAKGEYYND